MPTDKAGKFHMNTQRAMAANKHPQSPVASQPKPAADKTGTVAAGGIPEHLAAMHAEHGGKHMHVHHGEDGSITTHYVGEDGEVQGPHEHPDMESVKGHMDSVMGDTEGSDWETHPPEAMHQKHEMGGY